MFKLCLLIKSYWYWYSHTLTIAKPCCWWRSCPSRYDVFQPADHTWWGRYTPVLHLTSTVMMEWLWLFFNILYLVFVSLQFLLFFWLFHKFQRSKSENDSVRYPNIPRYCINLLHCAGGSWSALGWCWNYASLPDKTVPVPWCRCYSVCSFHLFPCGDKRTSNLKLIYSAGFHQHRNLIMHHVCKRRFFHSVVQS